MNSSQKCQCCCSSVEKQTQFSESNKWSLKWEVCCAALAWSSVLPGTCCFATVTRFAKLQGTAASFMPLLTLHISILFSARSFHSVYGFSTIVPHIWVLITFWSFFCLVFIYNVSYSASFIRHINILNSTKTAEKCKLIKCSHLLCFLIEMH